MQQVDFYIFKLGAETIENIVTVFYMISVAGMATIIGYISMGWADNIWFDKKDK